MMSEDNDANTTMPQPPPSEWGKINAGQAYGILAADIGRAMFCVPWKKYEMPIVFYMMEHSWGVAKTKQRGSRWPDPEPVRLNLNALASEIGCPRQRLYEARDRLKAMRVLIEDVDGFWINKEVQDWVDPETQKPILTLTQLLYAGRARTRNDRPEKASRDSDGPKTDGSDRESSVTPQRDTMSHPSVTPENVSSPVCHTPALHRVTPQRDTMSHPSVTLHIEERAPELDLEIKEDSQSIPGAIQGSDEEPFIPPPEPAPPKSEPIGQNSGDDVRHAFREAERLFPGGDMVGWTANWLREHRAVRVCSAMLKAADRKASRPSLYIQSILNSADDSRPTQSPRAETPAPKLLDARTYMTPEIREHMMRLRGALPPKDSGLKPWLHTKTN